MGLLFSRFKKKLSTKEVLEKIVSEMKTIEEFKQDTQERQKRVTRRLLVFTLLTYIISFTVFFFVERVRKQTLVFITGVIGFACFAWAFRKLLRWHYTRQIAINEEKFVELRKKKQKILEEVMDRETYKVAKEILDQFGEKPVKLEMKPQSTPLPQRPSPPQTELRRRIPEQRSAVRPAPSVHTPHPPQQPQQQIHTVVRDPRMLGTQLNPGRPLPRPVLPRDRGVMDRVLDYLVGDGPNQRFALICRHCGGHNGMSLQEEFEFIGYHCCYCFHWNPPRKQRLAAPRLPQPPPPKPVNQMEESKAQKKETVELNDDESFEEIGKKVETSDQVLQTQVTEKTEETKDDLGQQNITKQSESSGDEEEEESLK